MQYSPAGLLEVGASLRRGLNLPGAAGSHQRVGASLACGDFDGDNFADLAIGVPGENLERGAVVVIYRYNTGLANKWNTYLTQDTIGLDIVAPAGAEDRFGEMLATVTSMATARTISQSVYRREWRRPERRRHADGLSG